MLSVIIPLIGAAAAAPESRRERQRVVAWRGFVALQRLEEEAPEELCKFESPFRRSSFFSISNPGYFGLDSTNSIGANFVEWEIRRLSREQSRPLRGMFWRDMKLLGTKPPP